MAKKENKMGRKMRMGKGIKEDGGSKEEARGGGGKRVKDKHKRKEE